MPGKFVVPPGLLDGIAGDQFASLFHDPVLQYGLFALILGAIGAKLIGGEQR